jgi:pimeloyl-ACP methyl ester carboxylesterase/protein-S-isoprenylcysteine O-methyltransferase Ste14
VLLRAALAFLALPGVVAFFVPLALAATREGPPFRWAALVALLPGAALLLWCTREFAVKGRGTLAPWDPPRRLVASGIYGLTRNPMYVAVSLVLLGWAIGFASLRLLVYALLVMLAFHLHVVLVEEPALARTYRDEWTRYAARVPRWAFRRRRQVVAAWVAAVILAIIAGLIYEAVADGVGAGRYPPPGEMVDVGGRRLHVLCIGDGQPTVFFESSGWGTSVSGARARERVAARTRVCSYDRRGTGWSDPGPSTSSAGDLARDLAVLQDRAGLRGPFVIVASSIGGLTAEMFARQYPERVAGLVFADAASSLAMTLQPYASRVVRPAACTSGVLAHVGIIRLLDPVGLGREDTDEGRRSAALTSSARPWMQLCAMARGLPRTVEEFEAAPPLAGDVPLAVLSASSAEDLVPYGLATVTDVEEILRTLRDSHQQLAKQSSRGKWAIVPDSTHLIASSQPDAVVDVVFEMLDGL